MTAGTGLAGGAASGNATLSIASGGVIVDVAAAAAIAPTKIAGIAATRTFVDRDGLQRHALHRHRERRRVGIDNDLPEEKLDVDGNVRASAFRYALPRTSIVSVGYDAFFPTYSVDDYQNTVSGQLNEPRFRSANSNLPASEFEEMSAALQLPDGAQINTLTCGLFDYQNAHSTQVSLQVLRRGRGRERCDLDVSAALPGLAGTDFRQRGDWMAGSPSRA